MDSLSFTWYARRSGCVPAIVEHNVHKLGTPHPNSTRASLGQRVTPSSSGQAGRPCTVSDSGAGTAFAPHCAAAPPRAPAHARLGAACAHAQTRGARLHVRLVHDTADLEDDELEHGAGQREREAEQQLDGDMVHFDVFEQDFGAEQPASCEEQALSTARTCTRTTGHGARASACGVQRGCRFAGQKRVSVSATAQLRRLQRAMASLTVRGATPRPRHSPPCQFRSAASSRTRVVGCGGWPHIPEMPQI